MPPPTPDTSFEPSDAHPRRRARLLTGWLSARQVARAQSPGTDGVARHRHARAAVRARAGGPTQEGLIADWPASLAPHEQALRASAGGQRMLADGWRPALICDLRRVIAAQPSVFVDDPVTDRHMSLSTPATLQELAHLMLPLECPPADIQPRFDAEHQRWLISSPNPNLRITGRFGGEVAPGTHGIGFMFEVLGSFVSVAEIGGRYVLRDGYHRSHRLLAAGVVTVPALVRSYAEDEPVFEGPMIDRSIWAGRVPPTLADYHDDQVSADVWIDAPHTTAVVTATPQRLAVGVARAAGTAG